MGREEIVEEILKFLEKLPSLDLSEGVLGKKEEPYQIEGEYKDIDLSNARGYVKAISDFTLRLDASESRLDYLELKGTFGILDLSGSTIKKFVHSEAKIIFLDASGAEIEEEIS